MILVDLDDLAAEVGEWSFFDSNRFAHFEELAGTGLLLACSRCGVFVGLHRQERFDLAARKRRWLRALTHEAGNTWCVADHEPRVIVETAAHQQVAREHLLLDDDFLALAELLDVFHWNDDFVDASIHVHAGGTSLEVLFNLFFVAGLGVHDIPAARTVVRTYDLWSNDDFAVFVDLVELFIDQRIFFDDLGISFNNRICGRFVCRVVVGRSFFDHVAHRSNSFTTASPKPKSRPATIAVKNTSSTKTTNE